MADEVLFFHSGANSSTSKTFFEISLCLDACYDRGIPFFGIFFLNDRASLNQNRPKGGKKSAIIIFCMILVVYFRVFSHPICM